MAVMKARDKYWDRNQRLAEYSHTNISMTYHARQLETTDHAPHAAMGDRREYARALCPGTATSVFERHDSSIGERNLRVRASVPYGVAIVYYRNRGTHYRCTSSSLIDRPGGLGRRGLASHRPRGFSGEEMLAEMDLQASIVQ
jgi:hypothetical protein